MLMNRRNAVIVHDLVAIAMAWQLAWLARFNFDIPPPHFWHVNIESLPWVVAVQGLVAWYFGLYRGLWRFASLRDLWNIIRAVTVGVVTISLVLFVVNRLGGIPRSVLILYPVFLMVLLSGPRLTYRVWKDRAFKLGRFSGQERVLVLGGGRGGEAVVRDMLRDGTYTPVGLLDDQPRVQNSRIHDVPVLGSIDDLPHVADAVGATLIFIAIPSATSGEMQRIVRLCELTGRPFRTLPRLQDMIAGRSGLQELREVSIDDLLGRDKVQLDWSVIQKGLSERRVLVSGGGGSIGRELCRQIARLAPETLVILERNEFNLYRADQHLRREFPMLRVHPVLGDVCDSAAVDRVMREFAPDVVFHAAAFKHVPLLEEQSREALRNNAIGTWVLADAAARSGCRKFVMISTDKAVNPSSVMGASKRVAEMICDEMNRRGGVTRFITVRFGNVLGSDGSVVPLFREQIRAGGPVTVTHPDVSRYFMTIPEACQLILQAGAMGHGGEVFVLDMGEPVNIAYLADLMIRLSGKVPGRDIKIEFTGLRPGEKLHEVLFYEAEALERTTHPKIMLARHWRHSDFDLNLWISRAREESASFDEASCRRFLTELVPELKREPAVDGGKVVTLPRKQV